MKITFLFSPVGTVYVSFIYIYFKCVLKAREKNNKQNKYHDHSIRKVFDTTYSMNCKLVCHLNVMHYVHNKSSNMLRLAANLIKFHFW